MVHQNRSKSSDDGAKDIEEMLQNMSMTDEDNNISICANCGKEGANNNTCNKCKMVKYCNAVCKKVHKKKHKKDCEEYIRLATEQHNEELRIAAELHDIELFKQPPPEEDCPICFLLLPSMESGWRYYVCCGKVICGGCCYAPVYDNQGNAAAVKKCSFCRTLLPTTDKEMIKRYKKRMNAGDPIAVYNLGNYYRDGEYGLPQDSKKALECWHRAGELGNAEAYCCVGFAYYFGRGVEIDKKKARHYFELAAMRGSTQARTNLGIFEENQSNWTRSLKHHMIAVRSGHAKSLQVVKGLYSKGHATKEDYTSALQLYQEYLGEIKSVQRDKAAASSEMYHYH